MVKKCTANLHAQIVGQSLRFTAVLVYACTGHRISTAYLAKLTHAYTVVSLFLIMHDELIEWLVTQLLQSVLLVAVQHIEFMVTNYL